MLNKGLSSREIPFTLTFLLVSLPYATSPVICERGVVVSLTISSFPKPKFPLIPTGPYPNPKSPSTNLPSRGFSIELEFNPNIKYGLAFLEVESFDVSLDSFFSAFSIAIARLSFHLN